MNAFFPAKLCNCYNRSDKIQEVYQRKPMCFSLAWVRQEITLTISVYIRNDTVTDDSSYKNTGGTFFRYI